MGLFKTDKEKIKIYKKKIKVEEAKFKREEALANQKLALEKIKADRAKLSSQAGTRRGFAKAKESGKSFVGMMGDMATNFNANMQEDMDRSSRRRKKGKNNDFGFNY